MPRKQKPRPAVALEQPFYPAEAPKTKPHHQLIGNTSAKCPQRKAAKLSDNQDNL